MKITQLLLLIPASSAFVVPPQHHHKTTLQGKNLDEIETARIQFEKMMGDIQASDHLTAGSERRLEVEIELLKSLRDTDEAVDELMGIWMNELPSAGSSIQALRSMEHTCSPSGIQEEATLRGMIYEYGVAKWPEPASRLALLLFMQKRYLEAQKLVNEVLFHKPWHYEALYLNLLLNLRGNKLSAARMCLPPMSQPKRRNKWIDRMVRTAEQRLEKARKKSPTGSPSSWQ